MTAYLKNIENVLRLDAQSRCDYFVRKVADFEVVSGLFDKGGDRATRRYLIGRKSRRILEVAHLG